MGHYSKKFISGGNAARKVGHHSSAKYDWEPGKGKCPDGTFRKRFGKSKGWCTESKKKANRLPCSMMTKKGRRRTQRCKDKKLMRSFFK